MRASKWSEQHGSLQIQNRGAAWIITPPLQPPFPWLQASPGTQASLGSKAPFLCHAPWPLPLPQMHDGAIVAPISKGGTDKILIYTPTSFLPLPQPRPVWTCPSPCGFCSASAVAPVASPSRLSFSLQEAPATFSARPPCKSGSA